VAGRNASDCGERHVHGNEPRTKPGAQHMLEVADAFPMLDAADVAAVDALGR
jgi:hypothetical protein